MFLAGLALALPAQAEARVVHRIIYTAPSAAAATDLDYDHAKLQARVHGRWPDGGVHAGWSRGERLPLAIAANAPPIDWRGAKLNAPTVDERWTRVGDDYVLISNRTRQIHALVLAPVAKTEAEKPASAKKKPYVTTVKAKAKARPPSYYEK
jgi:Ni/Co efflux regulator RcnB